MDSPQRWQGQYLSAEAPSYLGRSLTLLLAKTFSLTSLYVDETDGSGESFEGTYTIEGDQLHLHIEKRILFSDSTRSEESHRASLEATLGADPTGLWIRLPFEKIVLTLIKWP